MFAIREDRFVTIPSVSATHSIVLTEPIDRDYIVQDDLMKAVRKVAEAKKHESAIDYKAV
jgi:hypothetical protein